MSFTGVLDIAISLTFLYLLISLVCTALNEMVATVLSLRSRSLSASISKILEDEELKERFYANGLVKGAISASQRGRTPSSGVPTGSEHSSYLDSKTFAMALLGSLNPDKQIPVVADIEESLKMASLPTGVRDILASALATGRNDITSIRDEVATWFDSAMDRLSGEYKRQIKWVAFLIGLFVAILLNVDSYDMSRALWRDQDLREQLANAADTYLQKNETSCPLPEAKKSDGASGGAQAPAPEKNPDEVASQVATSLSCQFDTVNRALEKARPFPLGWTFAGPLPNSEDQTKEAPRQLYTVLKQPDLWFGKLLGWLWTAVALSLGAPFWFDTLSKFMNIRGAGTKPDKTQEKSPGVPQ
jgi:hypothetical protein